jgi:hypothetical protein
MKIFCFDRENCGYFYYLEEEDYKNIDFSNKFINCPECTSLAAYVPDDFVMEASKEEYIQIYAKINKVFKEYDDDN